MAAVAPRTGLMLCSPSASGSDIAMAPTNLAGPIFGSQCRFCASLP